MSFVIKSQIIAFRGEVEAEGKEFTPDSVHTSHSIATLQGKAFHCKHLLLDATPESKWIAFNTQWTSSSWGFGREALFTSPEGFSIRFHRN